MSFYRNNEVITIPSCCVVIPAYKTDLTAEERLSIKQLVTVCPQREKIVIAPVGLILPEELSCFQRREFPEHYFRSIKGYNSLLLSEVFFQAFLPWDYILIYQLDCLIFQDQLSDWCLRGYSYIGSPWFEKFGNHKSGKLWRTGNGGLSLRHIRSALAVLKKEIPKGAMQSAYQAVSEIYVDRDYSNHESRKDCYNVEKSSERSATTVAEDLRRYPLNEDLFWSFEAPNIDSHFRIPVPEEALSFAFEKSPEWCFQHNGKIMPMGAHAWAKHDPGFWLKHLDQEVLEAAEGQTEPPKMDLSMVTVIFSLDDDYQQREEEFISTLSHYAGVHEVILVTLVTRKPLPACNEKNISNGVKLKWTKADGTQLKSTDDAISEVITPYVSFAWLGDATIDGGLQMLLRAGELTSAEVILSPPRIFDEENLPVEDDRWPIHSVVQGRWGSGSFVLPKQEAFFMACESGVRGVSGSSAANLFRTDILKKYPLSLTHDASIDWISWFCRNSLRVKLAVLPSYCANFRIDSVDHTDHVSKTSDVNYQFQKLASEAVDEYEQQHKGESRIGENLIVRWWNSVVTLDQQMYCFNDLEKVSHQQIAYIEDLKKDGEARLQVIQKQSDEIELLKQQINSMNLEYQKITDKIKSYEGIKGAIKCLRKSFQH
jgi:hypothetical protein